MRLLQTLFTGSLVSALALSSAPAATSASEITIDARPSQGQLLRGERQRVFIRIGITSPRPARTRDRLPLNIALVLDKSGSMRGDRIAEARRAALMGLERLTRNDVISVVAYDSTVQTLVPATTATNPGQIAREIRRLEAGGSTAIFAGVQIAAGQVREYSDTDRISRIILLSDGLANVGPKRPEDFERLGRELSGEGIIVSTIGLGTGYNEDLMAGLARTGEGNHAFVQEPQDLVDFFNKEFDEAVGVVAQDVEIIIRTFGPVRPIGSLGRSADVSGSEIVFKVGQLIGGSEQVLLAEVEVPSGTDLGSPDIAAIDLRYRALESGVTVTKSARVKATWTDSRDTAEGSADKAVMRDVTLLQARERRERAIKLRDGGDIDGARAAFRDNAAFLKQRQDAYGFEGTAAYEAERKVNEAVADEAASPAAWQVQRKSLRSIQSNQAGAKTKY